jgi:DNA-binding NarL/FixJ family response regulator
VSDTKHIRILSVEDHPVLRQRLARIIETEPDMVLVGHEANPVEAVNEFRRHRPDITLMDLRLPDTNGTDELEMNRKSS